MTIDAPLRCQRAQFSLPPGVVYLNSAYMGPLPIATQRAGERAQQQRAVPTAIAPADFFAPADHARALCATLIGADAERIALVPTTATAIAIAARHLAPRAGQTIVLPGGQFPSNVLAWQKFARRGVELLTVTAPSAAQAQAEGESIARGWNRRLLDAIDGRCAVVAIEPAHWTDGTRFDLDAIGAKARSVGAALVVDATQCVGAMPLDVSRFAPDLLVAHAYKSMLSHYGLGFAYLGARFDDAEPLEESWLLREGAEDFASLTAYRDGYAPGMRRFDSSIRANGVLVESLIASAKLLVQWRPARIEAYCRAITRDFVDRVRELGYGVADSGERAANLFGLAAPEGIDLETLRQRLAAREIFVSIRGASIRVSPHVYNEAGDLERLFRALSAD